MCYVLKVFFFKVEPPFSYKYKMDTSKILFNLINLINLT